MLGKGSGIDSVWLALQGLGASASKEETEEILRMVKARSLEKRGLLSKEDFAEIPGRVISWEAATVASAAANER